MTIAAGHAALSFGCASASIDAFTFSGAADFTGSGTWSTALLTAVRPPPTPATFSGHIDGNTITLKMTEAGHTTTIKFTKGLHSLFAHCRG